MEFDEDGTIWWVDVCGNESIQDAFWVSKPADVIT